MIRRDFSPKIEHTVYIDAMKPTKYALRSKGIMMLEPIFAIIVIAVLASIAIHYWDDITPQFQIILEYIGYVLLALLGIIFVIGGYHSWKDRGKSRGF